MLFLWCTSKHSLETRLKTLIKTLIKSYKPYRNMSSQDNSEKPYYLNSEAYTPLSSNTLQEHSEMVACTFDVREMTHDLKNALFYYKSITGPLKYTDEFEELTIALRTFNAVVAKESPFVMHCSDKLYDSISQPNDPMRRVCIADLHIPELHGPEPTSTSKVTGCVCNWCNPLKDSVTNKEYDVLADESLWVGYEDNEYKQDTIASFKSALSRRMISNQLFVDPEPEPEEEEEEYEEFNIPQPKLTRRMISNQLFMDPEPEEEEEEEEYFNIPQPKFERQMTRNNLFVKPEPEGEDNVPAMPVMQRQMSIQGDHPNGYRERQQALEKIREEMFPDGFPRLTMNSDRKKIGKVSFSENANTEEDIPPPGTLERLLLVTSLWK